MNTVQSINYSSQKNLSNSSGTTAKKAFDLLMILIWTRYTVYSFVLQIFYYIPYVQKIAGHIFPVAIAFLSLLALPYIAKRIRLADILVFLLGLLLLVASPIIWPKNAPYIDNSMWYIATSVLPMYLLGVCYDHNSLKNKLFYASLVGSGTMLLYQAYQLVLGRDLLYDGMGQAYYLLPSVMYLIYWAFEKNKAKYWVFALIGSVFVSSFGSRGPLLILLIFFAIRFFLKVVKAKSGVVKFFFIIGAVVGITVIISGDVLTNIAEFLSEKLGDMGFSTRVFDYFLEGNIADASGRDSISDTILGAIKDNPAFGHGLMGDRMIYNGASFAHNLFLELWCQFGLVFGTILSLLIVCLPIVSIKKQKDTVFANFILMLGCTILIKLMGSGSYLVEPYLFLLLGICTPIILKRNPSSE